MQELVVVVLVLTGLVAAGWTWTARRPAFKPTVAETSRPRVVPDPRWAALIDGLAQEWGETKVDKAGGER